MKLHMRLEPPRASVMEDESISVCSLENPMFASVSQIVRLPDNNRDAHCGQERCKEKRNTRNHLFTILAQPFKPRSELTCFFHVYLVCPAHNKWKTFCTGNSGGFPSGGHVLPIIRVPTQQHASSEARVRVSRAVRLDVQGVSSSIPSTHAHSGCGDVFDVEGIPFAWGGTRVVDSSLCPRSELQQVRMYSCSKLLALLADADLTG